jgi:hypothetical protein
MIKILLKSIEATLTGQEMIKKNFFTHLVLVNQ